MTPERYFLHIEGQEKSIAKYINLIPTEKVIEGQRYTGSITVTNVMYDDNEPFDFPGGMITIRQDFTDKRSVKELVRLPPIAIGESSEVELTYHNAMSAGYTLWFVDSIEVSEGEGDCIIIKGLGDQIYPSAEAIAFHTFRIKGSDESIELISLVISAVSLVLLLAIEIWKSFQ